MLEWNFDIFRFNEVCLRKSASERTRGRTNARVRLGQRPPRRAHGPRARSFSTLLSRSPSFVAHAHKPPRVGFACAHAAQPGLPVEALVPVPDGGSRPHRRSAARRPLPRPAAHTRRRRLPPHRPMYGRAAQWNEPGLADVGSGERALSHGASGSPQRCACCRRAANVQRPAVLIQRASAHDACGEGAPLHSSVQQRARARG